MCAKNMLYLSFGAHNKRLLWKRSPTIGCARTLRLSYTMFTIHFVRWVCDCGCMRTKCMANIVYDSERGVRGELLFHNKRLLWALRLIWISDHEYVRISMHIISIFNRVTDNNIRLNISMQNGVTGFWAWISSWNVWRLYLYALAIVLC